MHALPGGDPLVCANSGSDPPGPGGSGRPGPDFGYLPVGIHLDLSLVGRGGVGVEVLEKDLGVALYVRTDPNLTADQYRIEAGARQDIEQQLRILRHGQMFHVRPTKAEIDADTVTLASVDGMMVEIDTNKDPEDLGDLVTVSLSDIGRSWARGTLLE